MNTSNEQIHKSNEEEECTNKFNEINLNDENAKEELERTSIDESINECEIEFIKNDNLIDKHKETNVKTNANVNLINEQLKSKNQLDNQFDNNQIIEDDDSTTSSTHQPVDVPFKPNYVIAVLPSELETDEYSIYYVIKAIHIAKNDLTTDLLDSSKSKLLNKSELNEMIVKREYDDFFYLNHVLVNSAYPGYGLIVPPLPNKPNLDDIYLTTQEVLFNRNAFLTNLLFDEQYQKECWFLEQYLHAMIVHPTFGKDSFWHRFLMVDESPPKIKLKKNGNLFTSLFTNDNQEASSLFATSKSTTTRMNR